MLLILLKLLRTNLAAAACGPIISAHPAWRGEAQSELEPVPRTAHSAWHVQAPEKWIATCLARIRFGKASKCSFPISNRSYSAKVEKGAISEYLHLKEGLEHPLQIQARGRALNPQPSTLNPQPSTLNPQPSTLHPTPYTLHPKP